MNVRFLPLLLLAACSYKIEGPTPVVTGAVNERDQSTGPAYVCNAQGDAASGWLVDAIGNKFAPLPTSALVHTAGVAMPAVSLSGPESYTVPAAYVHFVDQTRMPIAMRTGDSAADAHTLPPGDYALQVTNLNGGSASAPAAIRVVPPPHISAVSLTTAGGSGASICADQAQTLTITGTNFRTDRQPVVTIGSHSFTGTATATTVTVDIPAGTFSAAETSGDPTVYVVKVTNPDGCMAPAGSDPVAAATVDAYATCGRLGTLSISPRFGWQQQNTSVTITNQFTQPSSQPFSAGVPRAFIHAPLLTASGPSAAQDIPLRHLAVVDQKTVTAVVPTCSGTSAVPASSAAPCLGGIAPGGPYDVRVIDQVNGSGTIVGAFTVVANPPPVITSLNPSSISTSGGNVTVTGTNFDVNGKHASVWLGAQVTGGIEFCQLATSGTPSDTSITGTVPAASGAACYTEDPLGNQTATASPFAFSQGQYLVRVQHATAANGGDVSFGQYAALIVTGASFNPTDVGVTGQATLNTARGDLGTAVGTDDLGNPYLYAVGGSTGTAPLASVEEAPIGLFGDLGGTCIAGACKFHLLERTPLPSARAGLSLVARTIAGDTTYLYAIGGKTGTGAGAAVVADVLRAEVLRNKDAPVMEDISTQAGGTLAAGTWYYRVSAIVSDPANPGGETLPSDEESVVVTGTQAAVVHWGCAGSATSYRIYRTASVNQFSNTETFLATVTASCSGPGTGTGSFTDDGSATCSTGASPCTDAPLPPGALGGWMNLTATPLTAARYDFQAKLVGSDIFVLGGCTAAAGCATAGDTGSIERFTFTNATDVAPVASAAAGTLQQARDQFALALAAPPAAHTNSTAYLLVFGGQKPGAAAPVELSKTNATGGQVVELATVAAGGSLSFTALASNSEPQGVGVGGWAEIAADQAFFEADTGGSSSATAKSSSLCGSSTCNITSSAGFSFNFNAGFPSYTTNGSTSLGSARYLLGEQLFRAFIYAVGGFQSPSALTPTNTVGRIVY